MDIIGLHDRAVDGTARLVDGVGPEQMGLPTPCPDWDVRALLTHLVAGSCHADLLGDDPAAAYRRSAAALHAAWQDPALLDRQFEIPIGILPGRAAFNVRLVETVIHGWDLAKATGQHPAFDPEVVRTAAQFAQSGLSGDRPPGAPFAPPVAVADELPEIDRLAAFLGRTP